jgi:hypothetical protein
MEEDDIPFHIPTAFKVGERVTIAAEVKQAHAWHHEWSETHTRLVGKTGKISSVDQLRGFRVVISNAATLDFPSPALARVSGQDNCVIDVPGVT